MSWAGLEELRPVLFRHAKKRCRNEAEAEDIIQETFIRAARYRPALNDPARLKAWVLRIASNVHRDLVRREVRYTRAENQDEWLHSIESENLGEGTSGVVAEHGTLGSIGSLGSLEVEMHEALHHLPQAFDELPASDREVLKVFYGGSQNCLDLAVHFEITRSLAKVRVFRARKRLIKALRRSIGLSRHESDEVFA